MQEALEEQNKARIEQAKKMDTLIKRMDHTERARRENEAPLLQEAYAQKIKASPALLQQSYATVQALSAVQQLSIYLESGQGQDSSKCPT